MQRIEFVTVDVFTDRQFGGNQLAVVSDATGLSDIQMQQIAREFNLSETTFVLPSERQDCDCRVRIFTPVAEMPFAGHPNVGTAFVLANAGQVLDTKLSASKKALVFEELAGTVEMQLQPNGARLRSPQPFTELQELNVDVIADACSLGKDEINTTQHEPVICSCGVPFTIAAVTSRDALTRAAPKINVFDDVFTREQSTGIHLYYVADDGVVHTRMFAPQHGILEDPATGSANVALAGLLASLSPEADATLDFAIEQGVDMGRASLLHASAGKSNGVVEATWIAGQCVPMMRGALVLREG
jgi:trans-2,3-dihydro-3-hydroxyanthranilate isomerase